MCAGMDSFFSSSLIHLCVARFTRRTDARVSTDVYSTDATICTHTPYISTIYISIPSCRDLFTHISGLLHLRSTPPYQLVLISTDIIYNPASVTCDVTSLVTQGKNYCFYFFFGHVFCFYVCKVRFNFEKGCARLPLWNDSHLGLSRDRVEWILINTTLNTSIPLSMGCQKKIINSNFYYLFIEQINISLIIIKFSLNLFLIKIT